jgi:hypothetical protein
MSIHSIHRLHVLLASGAACGQTAQAIRVSCGSPKCRRQTSLAQRADWQISGLCQWQPIKQAAKRRPS